MLAYDCNEVSARAYVMGYSQFLYIKVLTEDWNDELLEPPAEVEKV
jgi:hypothetical protein